MIKVILKPNKEQSLQRFHPWVFSGAIKKIEGVPFEGEVVEVYSADNRFLAIGHYQLGSITVRIINFNQEPVDYLFWKNKIDSSLELRKSLCLTENPYTNVYRLINAEGDGLPGLVIDIYNRTAVIQVHSAGMQLSLDVITKALTEVYNGKIEAVYSKSAGNSAGKNKQTETDSWLYGQCDNFEVLEFGNKFIVDWKEGQKTGFFIDQRDNRKLLESYSKDKTVLNCFSYTGGFSVYAVKGGAKVVHSVDSSEKAIELANRNISLNCADAPHQGYVMDVFEYLNRTDIVYDLIILDPPAFAKHKSALSNALQGYKRLNAKAIAQINKGGILFTFSCSQAVSREQFRQAVFSAATVAKRNVKILHQLFQPPDHPVSIYHPEGEYLKGLVLYVE